MIAVGPEMRADSAGLVRGGVMKQAAQQRRICSAWQQYLGKLFVVSVRPQPEPPVI